MATRLVMGIVLLLPTPALAQGINKKVVDFCQSHVGQKVDSGQCSALAWAALHAAHAKDLNDFKQAPGKDDYVWGELIYASIGAKGQPAVIKGSVWDIRAGDVVQYRNAAFHGKGDNWSYDHHTSVISHVQRKANEIEVFEQNVNGQQKVRKTTLNLADLHQGWIRVYRPEARSH
jgi:hypothetical protein